MKPMLAATLKPGDKVNFPVLLSPKLDGVRCLIIKGRAMSRSLKEIPNKYVQDVLGTNELDGLDGELIVGSPTAPDAYRKTVSAVMSEDGEPAFKFHVFDNYLHVGDFQARLRSAFHMGSKYKSFIAPVPHSLCVEDVDLLNYEEDYVVEGYEGVMLRDPAGAYKFGRSTMREGGLLKLKRFVDAEAVIVGREERMENLNPRQMDELGRNRRSSHKAGKRGMGTLGALIVQDCKTKVQFSIGTGFDDAERARLWGMNLHGVIVKYKSQPTGVKDKPRFPVYLGMRDARDM